MGTRRRALLAAIASGLSLAGCLSGGGTTTSEPTKENGWATSSRRTVDAVSATFRVVDRHAPTDDTASATFDDERVTVTGAVDPSGCNRPALSWVRYGAADGVVRVRVGTESRYETTEVECGNASFDYRCVVTAERGQTGTVDVVHDYQGKDDRSFTLVRG